MSFRNSTRTSAHLGMGKWARPTKPSPFYRRLADSRGYEGHELRVLSAYTALGKYYFANGNVPLGRKYLWAY